MVGFFRKNVKMPSTSSTLGLFDLYPLKKMAKTAPPENNVLTESEEIFEKAAEVFRVMSAPMRLKIISHLCDGERNVSYLLSKIDTTQPNMSQHLTTLYQAGVLGKRREGVQIYYRIVDDRVANLCRAVCTQIATDAHFAPEPEADVASSPGSPN